MPAFNTVNAVDYGLIALYFAIVVCVGFYAARKNRGTDDYFKAGGQVPWVLAGMSNWVSGFSAFMFVAAAGYTYRIGIGAIVVFTTATWCYLVGYFVFAPLWRRAPFWPAPRLRMTTSTCGASGRRWPPRAGFTSCTGLKAICRRSIPTVHTTFPRRRGSGLMSFWTGTCAAGRWNEPFCSP